MDGEQFKKRIVKMITDIFPLDRLLPLETVYSIFNQEYAKSNDRNLFFRDRKFQRLREGYFAVFIALSLDDLVGEKHHLVFPNDPASDVIMARTAGEDSSVPAYRFDIKEFTNFSGSFENFINETIIPKLDIYNLAIASYRNLNSRDLQHLFNGLRNKDIVTRVWLLGAPTKEEDHTAISKVTVVDKEKILYDKVIDLDQRLDQGKPITIYHNTLRFK